MTYTTDMDDADQRKDDIVYFTGDTSARSWAGVIDDSNDMTDKAVNEYIKDVKPELFAKLRGMKFGSSDIPLTFKPQRDLHRLDDMDNQRQPRCQLSQQSTVSTPSETVERSVANHLQDNSQIPKSSLKLKTPRHALVKAHHQLKLDRIERQTILTNAEKLYPDIEVPKNYPSDFHDKNTKPDHAFKYPTNSRKAYELRALKQLEINDALAEVSKYEKALKKAKSLSCHSRDRDPSPDASVLITRPFYMEPRRDGYKKQGLTRYDWVKFRNALRKSALNCEPNSPTSIARSAKRLSSVERYCYCREPDDGSEMIRCSKQWCPVGWFHLRCTGLDRLPFVYEEFHCAYCTDDIGPLITKGLLDGDCSNRRDPVGKVVSKIAKNYQNSEIATEIVWLEKDDSCSKDDAYKSKTFDDDDGEQDNTGDVEIAIADSTLRDKIIRWSAINKAYDEDGPALDDEQDMIVSSANTTYIGDSENVHRYAEEESGDARGEVSLIEASSTVVADESNGSANERDQHTDDTEGMESESTIFESIEQDNEIENDLFQVAARFDPTYPRFPVFNESIYEARFVATTRTLVSPQPSTITDSSHITSRDRNGAITPPRADLSAGFVLLNGGYKNSLLQTPLLGLGNAQPRSKRPWGTPINIGDLITEPTSPSPPGKSRSNGIDDVVQEDKDNTASDEKFDTGVEDADDACEIPDSEDEAEEVPFMLDSPIL